MTLERGTLLHKRYRVVEILGQGGMGSVYRAVDENLGVDIALKENLFTTDEYARQFRLEAVILANLRHPNLPRVSDHFVLGEEGQYLVMDFIDGEDLRQRMERTGSISEEEAIMIGAAMCDALAYLHTRKPPILHRDIKPGNVKITPDGHIFLVDFGLAKVVQGTQATTTGARAMTPGYSPPEQYGTARTDPRTDIYSLGATLYAALTGIIPEDGLARAMDNAQLTPLRKRNSKISRRLAAAIEQAMAIDPVDRFQNADDFKKALLGAKSKTQRLAGNYTVPPPPIDEDGGSNKYGDDEPGRSMEKKPGLMAIEPDVEFKPPKRKRKKRKGGCLWQALLILLLLVGAAGAVSYFYPQLVPGQVASYIPWIGPAATPTPVPTPVPTLTPVPTEPPTLEPTFTPTVEPPTEAPTAMPTPTVVEASPTPIPQAASPTPTGGGYGQVSFASDRDGVPQIYQVGVDGSDLHPLTSMPEGACQPAWSPDGAKLVFTSPCRIEADTYREASLYSMNPDGSELTPLTTAPGGDFDPAWSPDGKRIAFTSLRDGKKDVYVLTLENMQIVRLTNTDNEENSQPAWSPSGEQLAFVKKRFDASQIWIMSSTGEDPNQMVRSGQELWDFEPIWSRDGQEIIFSQRQVNVRSLPWLMKIRIENSETQTASHLDLGGAVSGFQNIQFSPDGYWIVYEGGEGLDRKDIYYMTASGGTRNRLTSDNANDFDPAWRPIAAP